MADAHSDELRARKPTFQTTEAVYLLPNDSSEHDRLMKMHQALVALDPGKYVLAPVDEATVDTVIDVGCGGGETTRELRRYFVSAKKVYGIDLSPVPARPSDADDDALEFVQGDVMKLAGVDHSGGGSSSNNSDTAAASLHFGPESVDFVFARMLVCGITDWPGYVSRMYETLRPGRWAQMTDWCEDVYFFGNEKEDDGSINGFIDGVNVRHSRPPNFLPQNSWPWLAAIRRGAIQKGLDPDAGRNIPRYMRDAGFVDISTKRLIVPFWRGWLDAHPEAERAYHHYVGDPFALFWHMIPRITEGLEGMDEREVRRLQEDSRRDLGEERGKYMVHWVTVGRKPEAEPEAKLEGKPEGEGSRGGK